MPPRRAANQASTINGTTDTVQPPTPPPVPFAKELRTLRTHWKWAAFSQFYFTFAPIGAVKDVSIQDIEDDLTRDTNLVLPRVMQKLLYSISYDRKISLDNWQTALRKQYYKREPFANPIGPEPFSSSDDVRYNSTVDGEATPAPETKPEENGEVSTPHKVGLTSVHDDSTPNGTPTPEEFKADDTEEILLGMHPKHRRYMYGYMDVSFVVELEKQETKNWLDLPMLEKLDCMYLLTEWQFHNPNRVKSLMRSEDEYASWRIEPIGYDSKANAYWLIGTNRLWIQRTPPKPPRSSTSNKRKRTGNDTSKAKGSSKSHKRPRLQAPPVSSSRAVKSKESREIGIGRSRGRAAKTQANLKLDAQARELEALSKQAAAISRGRRGGPSSRPLGTRLSARLRGAQEDEWQPIPDEWLHAQKEDVKKPVRPKTGLDSDSDSDLTELSDDENEEPSNDMETPEGEDEGEGKGEDEAAAIPEEPSTEVAANRDEMKETANAPLPADFVEWETLCVTLYEWEHIAEQWPNATHYAEKALFRALTRDIIPPITEELREIEKQKRLEEAVVHRKRSSRIATKESVKEEQRESARRQAEEEEKNGRARRAEARQQKEEMDRQKREAAREERRKAKEAQEAKEVEEIRLKEQQEANEKAEVDIMGEKPKTNGQHHNRRHAAPRTNGTAKRSKSDWELDCEICYKRGINMDDGTPLLCCGSCGKWQHIQCHDYADQQAGRPKRNWEVVEFICRQCSMRRAAAVQNGQPPHNPYMTLNPVTVPQAAPPYNSYPQARTSYTSHSQQYTQPSYIANSKIAFTHYQPQQHGFSSSDVSYNSHPQPRIDQQRYQEQQYAQQPAGTQPLPPNNYYRPTQSGVAAWNIATPQGYVPEAYISTERTIPVASTHYQQDPMRHYTSQVPSPAATPDERSRYQQYATASYQASSS